MEIKKFGNQRYASLAEAEVKQAVLEYIERNTPGVEHEGVVLFSIKVITGWDPTYKVEGAEVFLTRPGELI